MEATKWLKRSVSVSRTGDSASVQAVTRVNARSLPASAQLPATSCLGAFSTTAARARGEIVGAGVQKPSQNRTHAPQQARHAAWIAEGAAALARLYQHHRECHEHGAARMPEREAMALGLDGDALDRGRHAGSGQRLPTAEGSQAASNVAGRSGSSPQQKFTRPPCSPSHRRLTSISAATASQCSTKRRDIPVFITSSLP